MNVPVDYLTPAQALYLDEFDRLLAVRHCDGPALFTGGGSVELGRALRGLYAEAHKLPPWKVLGTPRPPRVHR